MKKFGAIVNVRTNTMRAVPCVLFILQSRASCEWQWNASHAEIPLLSDTDLALGVTACNIFARIQGGSHLAEGIYTGSGDVTKEQYVTKEQ